MKEKIQWLLKNLHVVIIILVIAVSFSTIVLEFVKRVAGFSESSASTAVVNSINFSEEYPFSGQDQDAEETQNTVSSTSVLQRYESKAESLKSAIKNTKYYILGYYHYIEAAGFVDKITGITVFDGNSKVVSLKNGRVDWYDPDPVSEEEIQTVSGVVKEFADFVTGEGAQFLYIGTAKGICEEDPELPYGVWDYGNDSKDDFIQALDSAGVPYLDLRKAIHEDGLDHASLFYKTDHHWNAEGEFWAAGKVADYVNETLDFGIDTEYLDSSLYETETLPYLFLGAEGRKVSAGYISPEPFDMLIPTYDTDYTVEHPSWGISKSGTFKEVMYDWEVLNNPDSYEVSYYDAQLDGNSPLTIIHNNNCSNGKSVLLICDSFTLGMAPYLSTGIETVYMIDYRDAVGFTGSYRTFIQQVQPELVLLTTMPNLDNLYKFTETGSIEP